MSFPVAGTPSPRDTNGGDLLIRAETKVALQLKCVTLKVVHNHAQCHTVAEEVVHVPLRHGIAVIACGEYGPLGRNRAALLTFYRRNAL